MTFCEIKLYVLCKCLTLFTLGTVPQNTSNQNFFFLFSMVAKLLQLGALQLLLQWGASDKR